MMFKIETQIKKIRNLLKSKVIIGPRYIMAWLKIYTLVKQSFLLNFEQGNEVMIPEELSQDDMPLSFRYYDPIIILIQERLSYNKREYFKVKKQLGLLFDKKLSLRNQVKELMKVGNEHKKKSKAAAADLLTFEELQPGEIDYFKSKHTM